MSTLTASLSIGAIQCASMEIPPAVLDPPEYLRRHGLPALMQQWQQDLATRQPESPFEDLIRLIQEHVNSLQQHLVCGNPWCEARILLKDYEDHMLICTPQRWHKCARCDQRVDNGKMQEHRESCKLVRCAECGELVFPKMLLLCPRSMTNREVGKGPRESPAIEPELGTGRATRTETWAPTDLGIKQLQSLWRTYNSRRQFGNLAFKLIWDRIEFAREMKLAKSDTTESMTRRPSAKAKSVRALLGSPLKRSGTMETSVALDGVEDSPATEHTREELTNLLKLTEGGKLVPYETAIVLVRTATKLLQGRSVITKIETPFQGEAVVIGDLHGQLKDFFHILKIEGFPRESKIFVFNGDFVDRGPNGCEVLLLIFALLCTFPRYVFLNRGNHEDRNTNQEYGFFVEVTTKYEDTDLFEEFCKSYRSMPLVHVLDGRVMIVHGGLPRKLVKLDSIVQVGHVSDIPTVEQRDEYDEMLVDLLWSDPVETFKSRSLGMRHIGTGWRSSSRGCGIEYTTEHSNAFLALNKLEMVVRSHEMVPGGYHVQHNGKSITVFSASDYCGVSMNRAALVSFSAHSSQPQFKTWFLKEMPPPLNFEGDLPAPDAAASLGRMSLSNAAFSAERQDCLEQIQDMIWHNRYRLLSEFCSADEAHVGYVSKLEWSETLRRVSFWPLPWYFLCPYLTEVVEFQGLPAVKYSQFLCGFDTVCGANFKLPWIKEKLTALWNELDIPESFLSETGDVPRRQSTNDFVPIHSPAAPLPPNELWKRKSIDFNQFCSVLRRSKIGARLTDDELFVLFTYLDGKRMGHIVLGELDVLANQMQTDSEAELESGRKPKKSDSWVYHSMMQLQQLFVLGQRKAVEQTFRVLDKDRNGKLEFSEFKRLLRRLNKQLPQALTAEQMEKLFQVVDVDHSGFVDIIEFTEYFTVKDMRAANQKLPFRDRRRKEIESHRVSDETTVG